MTLETAISTYGYFAIFAGIFLEGETVLILGGLAAHEGYLSLTGVILCAGLAALLGDNTFFHLGRAYGAAFIARRPRLEMRTQRVFRLLHRHRIPLMLGFRFLYGMRIVTPFSIGTARVSAPLFTALDAVGVAVWTCTFAIAGTFFGHAAEILFGKIKQYEVAIFLTIATSGTIVLVATMLAWWRKPSRHLRRRR